MTPSADPAIALGPTLPSQPLMTQDEQDFWKDISALWVDELVQEPPLPPPPPKKTLTTPRTIGIRYLTSGAHISLRSDNLANYQGIPLRISGPKGLVHWEIPPGGRRLLPTGMAVELPKGSIGVIAPSCQPSSHTQLWVDTGSLLPGWDKEIVVCVRNTSRCTLQVAVGVVLAQVIVTPVWLLPTVLPPS